MVTPLRDILKTVAHTWGLEPAARVRWFQEVWPQVVGRVLAEVTSPVALRGGRLRVRADSPAAGQEIRLRREAILRALAREVGEGAVTDIIPVVRRVTRAGNRQNRRPPR